MKFKNRIFACPPPFKKDHDVFSMQFRTYEALRREHDAQIIRVAMEAGLRISPEQWSALLYGDQKHKSDMQSIIDKVVREGGGRGRREGGGGWREGEGEERVEGGGSGGRGEEGVEGGGGGREKERERSMKRGMELKWRREKVEGLGKREERKGDGEKVVNKEE